MTSERCEICRAPATHRISRHLCDQCGEAIRAMLVDAPPIPPNVIRKIARILSV